MRSENSSTQEALKGDIWKGGIWNWVHHGRSDGVAIAIAISIATDFFLLEKQRSNKAILPKRTQRLKKYKIALRDWNFQAGVKFSSEPPTKTPILVGIIGGQDLNIHAGLNFQARLRISSEI